ncbi:MAG: DEAD/DEAH box helicase [Leptospirillia bacterium]
MRFDELNIPHKILAGVAKAGFHECTPIQEKSLPISLSGKDVVGQAQTGTGKTAAFLINIFSRLLQNEPVYKGNKPAPRALVIAPTRELIVQIEKDAALLGSQTDLRRLVVYGGMDYDKQREKIKTGPELLMGTPGRLIDYFKQGTYTLEGIEMLVIDEADRMFDMGFIDDIRYMLRRMPKPGVRQTMLFSATFPWRVKDLAYEHMHEPQEVSVNPDQVTAENIREVMYFVGNHEKFSLLVGTLRGIIGGRTMVFVNTKRCGEDLEYWLAANDIEAEFISGDVPQKKRLRLIDSFRSGALPVLIATDVASRGLHIDDVSHVINYDVPQDAEDYVHRIGRTARAGAEGDAITFGCETYSEYITAVEAYIGRKIPLEAPEEDRFVEVKQPYRRRAKRGERPSPRPAVQESRSEHEKRKRKRRDRPHGGSEQKTARGGGNPPQGGQPVSADGAGAPKKRRRRRRKKSGAVATPKVEGSPTRSEP